MKKYNKLIKKIALVSLLFVTASIFASPTIIPKTSTGTGFDKDYFLALIALVLLLPIYLLAKTFLFTAKMLVEKEKERNNNPGAKTVLTLLFTIVSSSLMAQEAMTATVTPKSDLLTISNILLGVILLETIIIVFFGAYVLTFLKLLKPKVAVETVAKKSFSFNKWWKKTNNFIPFEEEDDLDSGHNYDGIRELDNVIPPWFTAAFVVCIIFAGSYLWRYHVSESAPLQIEEYAIEMSEAEKEKEEFLKSAANNIDENSIKMLDVAGVAEGKNLFTANCVACHAANGASVVGGVGPNLTDAYWLHGGSIKDIFKTLKYGWPEKGMKAWTDQFSPKQMAQVASYVKSISTANLKGKDAQGDLFSEEVAKDTIAKAIDTVIIK